MQKINFQNLPSTTTPVNATNMNGLQTNVENAINIFDLYNDTSGSDWQTMMKNKIDYCIANMDSSKENTSAFINGGWSGVNYGFGICSKINSNYQLIWYSNDGTYLCRKVNNQYDYEILHEDTGWIDLSNYLNTTYFAIRSGFTPMARKLNGVVYFKGAIYCSTAVNGNVANIFESIPNEIRSSSEHTGAGVHYQLGTPYKIFCASGNIAVSEETNIQPTYDFQGYSLSDLNPYIVD